MKYQIDPAHTHAQFKVRHLMVSNVKGDFDKVTGTVEYDEANHAASSIDITVDVASISTREPQRDAHLKSADFFDVEKYPTITFVSKGVVKSGENSFEVVGDLTLHGQTRPNPAHTDQLLKQVLLIRSEKAVERKNIFTNMCMNPQNHFDAGIRQRCERRNRNNDIVADAPHIKDRLVGVLLDQDPAQTGNHTIA